MQPRASCGGFRKVKRFQETHVAVPHGHRGRRSGVVFHSSVDLLDYDILRRDDGISLTTPIRTVFDLTSLVRRDELESVIEQCLDQQMFAVADLHRIARRLAKGERKGSGTFVELIGQRPADQRPVTPTMSSGSLERWNRAVSHRSSARCTFACRTVR